jgi:hypothetical protein
MALNNVWGQGDDVTEILSSDDRPFGDRIRRRRCSTTRATGGASMPPATWRAGPAILQADAFAGFGQLEWTAQPAAYR